MNLPFKKSHFIALTVIICLAVLALVIVVKADFDWDRDGFTKAQGDCDTWDGSEFPGQLWYADCDGDTFKDTFAVKACDLAKANTKSPCPNLTAPNGGWTHNNPGALADCNDVDPNEFPGQLWYADCDGDSFMRPIAIKACDSALTPCADGAAPRGGWSNKNPGALADCDDTDPGKNPGQKELKGDGIDNDCDGVVM